MNQTPPKLVKNSIYFNKYVKLALHKSKPIVKNYIDENGKALEVILLIEQPPIFQHQDLGLIQEAKDLVSRYWEIKLGHIPRSMNNVAHYLAKQALKLMYGYHMFILSQFDILSILRSDNFTMPNPSKLVYIFLCFIIKRTN